MWEVLPEDSITAIGITSYSQQIASSDVNQSAGCKTTTNGWMGPLSHRLEVNTFYVPQVQKIRISFPEQLSIKSPANFKVS